MAKVWVTGSTGMLGPWVVRALAEHGHDVVTTRVELGDRRAIALDADVVVHAAAMASAADCAKDPARAEAINVGGSRAIAEAVRARGARMVHVSTDNVFDGERAPYAEDAETSPISVYGRTKRDAEVAVLASGAEAVVARAPLLFGPSMGTRRSFFDGTLDALRSGAKVRAFDDEWRTPGSYRSVADALARLVTSGLTGVVHIGGPERMSRLDMVRRLAAAHGLSDACVEPASRTSVPGEPRPRDLALVSTRFEVRAGSFEDELRAMA